METYRADCDCPDCESQRPKPECEACKAKDKAIAELIAALSLKAQDPVTVPIYYPAPTVWPPQHPHPSTVPYVYPTYPVVTC